MGDKIYRNKEWIHEKYWEEGMSMSEMAELASCSENAVRTWMVEHDIPRRS